MSRAMRQLLDEWQELFRYVDRSGMPSRTEAAPGFEEEDAVTVRIPSRLLRAARATIAEAANLPESASLDVLREFVEDVKLAHGTGNADDIDPDALDWPDLLVTYRKACSLVAQSEAHEPDPLKVLVEVERGLVVSVRSDAALSVRVLDRDQRDGVPEELSTEIADAEAWADGLTEQLQD